MRQAVLVSFLVGLTYLPPAQASQWKAEQPSQKTPPSAAEEGPVNPGKPLNWPEEAREVEAAEAAVASHAFDLPGWSGSRTDFEMDPETIQADLVERIQLRRNKWIQESWIEQGVYFFHFFDGAYAAVIPTLRNHALSMGSKPREAP